MAPMTDPAPAPQSAVCVENPTLLIVDDSRLMRHALKKILSADFNLVEAADGEEAWEKLQTEPSIQAIFSDLSMPNLDGYGLLERVRKSVEARINSLPFIVITGKEGDDASLRSEAQALGANEIVCKPFKSEEIIGMTNRFLAGDEQGDAEAEALRLAEEAEAQRLAEETARLAAEQEARRIAEEAEAQRQAEETARLAAAQEARRVAEEAEAQRQAEETSRLDAEAEAQRAAEESASQQPVQEELFEGGALEDVQLAVKDVAEQAANDAASEDVNAAVAEAANYTELPDIDDNISDIAAAEPQRFPFLTRTCIRLAMPFMRLSNYLLRLNKDKQLAALRERL